MAVRFWGSGRGLGRIEFDGFRSEIGESRQRFTEYTEAILNGLETGIMEYEGELYHQPRTEIRPRPFATFKRRTFASAVSPESIGLMARLGVGLMIIAQKPWDIVDAELSYYRQRYFELNGEESSKPILALFVGVNPDSAGAQRMRDVYLQRYAPLYGGSLRLWQPYLSHHNGIRILWTYSRSNREARHACL